MKLKTNFLKDATSPSYSNLKEVIRDVPDFPKKGILFRDITPLLESPGYLQSTIVQMCMLVGKRPDKIVGIESRGFIFGSAMSFVIGAGFVPVRKKGKLPCEKWSEVFSLEYGNDHIEVHKDSIKPGEKVVIVDDVLATGGTAKAAANLVKACQGEVVCMVFLIELTALHARKSLKSYRVESLVKY